MNFSKCYKVLAALVVSSSLLVGPALAETPFSPPPIPNFHQVNERVYRGGQPAPDTWHHLATMGIKTVIDLRREDEHNTVEESKAVTALGMKYVNVPMKGVVSPTDGQIIKVLTLLDSKEPVFVHCKRGADRTGTVIACYRIAHDRWERQQALKEAKSLGMGMVQFGLKHYIMAFQPTALFQSATVNGDGSSR
jgi:tyrosine-protein phosphatase SIW14